MKIDLTYEELELIKACMNSVENDSPIGLEVLEGRVDIDEIDTVFYNAYNKVNTLLSDE